MHQTSAEGVEDMIQLGDLTESGIMHNVQMRYHNKMIYVRKINKILYQFACCYLMCKFC